MNGKLIVVAAGSFGLGALVGWAVTADRRDQRTKADTEVFNRIVEEQSHEILSLSNRLAGDRTPALTEDELVIDQASLPLAVTSETGLDGFYVTSEDSDHQVGETESIELVTEVTIPENTPRENFSESRKTDEEIDAEEFDQVIHDERKTNLQKFLIAYAADPEEAEFMATVSRTQKDREQMPGYTAPQVITRDQYAMGPLEDIDAYDKVTLSYYPAMRVLLDEDDEVVEDIDWLVGWRSLSQFGGESGDPDVVFVRNENLPHPTDFEIVQMHEDPPAHIRYGMRREEYESQKMAGNFSGGRSREEDE